MKRVRIIMLAATLASTVAALAETSAPIRAAPEFSAKPTAGEIQRVRILEELIIPMGTASPTAGENQVLAAALISTQKTRAASGAAEIVLLEQFLQRFPNSAWAPALWTNLGLEYYRCGAFSKALDAWQRAWDLGKSATDPQACSIINRAVAELAKMHARLGHMTDLERIFAEIGNRPMSGSPAETIAHTRDALSNMKTRPEISFRCGPYALDGILALRNPADPARAMLRGVASTTDGTSLASLLELATKSNVSATAVRRNGAPNIPVPSVVHWKLGHFGALLRRENGRYLLQDPTFGNRQWIEQRVIDEESSGYFLLTGIGADLSRGWQAISAKEAAGVWGKGNTSSSNPNGTGPNNPTPPTPPNSCPGMAFWTVHLMLTSLNLRDTPLSYRPPVGPAISFSLSYDMRESNQPATFSFSNFGNRWNFNYASTLTFDTNNAYLRSGEGGTQEFTNFDNASMAYPVRSSRDVQTRSIVVRQSATVYQQQFPDGSMNVFELVDGSGRAYQTKFIDPQGNMIQFGYDGLFRLNTITDAIGQSTTLAYTFPSDNLKVTKITDPFGRTAQFSYNGSGQLTRITDAVGMTSDFTYGGADAVLTLVTGYGTTSFAFTDSGNNQRILLVSLPDGSREKFESSTAAGYPTSDPVAPQGMPVLNQYHEFRNTFHWDRKAMEEAPNDYTKATVYHFMHSTDNAMTGLLLESVKRPLENREWYFYQGQNVVFPGFMNDGILDNKTFIGRVLDDGTTQLTQLLYDTVGNLTQITDPIGRVTNFLYAVNGIDLLTIAQATGPGSVAFLANLTYNSQHRPLTVTDGAGQTTTLTYNAKGQVLTLTNAKNEVSTNTYDVTGYLTSIAGPEAGATALTTLTYDSAGRTQSSVDSLGHAVTYAYDNLNRVLSLTYPDGTQNKVDYQLLNVSKITDRLLRVTQFSYDQLGRPITQTDALGHITKYLYCACGSPARVTDELGRTTSWQYDIQGRKIAKIYADGSKTSYFYENTTSRLRAQSDARQQVRFYQYNADDTLRSIDYSAPSGSTPSVSITYDPFFLRPTSITDGMGTTDLNYKPYSGTTLGAGQLASTRNSLGELTYNYDELGRLILRSIDGVANESTFDALGRISAAKNPLGVFSFGYLAGSRLQTAIYRPNGQNTFSTYFGNSGDQRLKSISHLNPGGAPLSTWNYVYDAAGQITTWSQQRDSSAARVLTPQHDATGRLTAATLTNPSGSYGYTYDDASNRLTETVNSVVTTASYNSLNELSALAPPVEVDRTFEWDAENRLVAINYTGTSDRTEFAYDALSRRVAIVERTAGNVISTRRFLWDGFDLAEERDANGNVVKRYFPQGVEIVSGANPGPYFYALDHLDSVTEVTDASGTLRARYAYDPFGRRVKVSGDLDFDLGYTGHFQHARSGLTLAVFRAYDSNLGRWISRDPTEEIAGLNLYAYVNNRPLGSLDPLGLDEYSLGLAAIAKGKQYLLNKIPTLLKTTVDGPNGVQVLVGTTLIYSLEAFKTFLHHFIEDIMNRRCKNGTEQFEIDAAKRLAEQAESLIKQIKAHLRKVGNDYQHNLSGGVAPPTVLFPEPGL